MDSTIVSSNGTELDERVINTIIKVAEFLKKEQGSLLVDFELTLAQYNLLLVLAESKNAQNTVTQVSRLMNVSGSNITGISKRLGKRGFIERTVDERDERVRILRLSAKGASTLKAVASKKSSELARILEGLNDQGKEQCLNLLRPLIMKTSQNN